MKVVHIFWSLGFGGIETMLINIANYQAKLGIEVHVIIINDLIEESIKSSLKPNVSFYCLYRKPHSANLAFIKRLNRQIDTIVPDYIHLHDSTIWSMLSISNQKRGVALTLHDVPKKSKRRFGFLNKVYPILDIKAGGNTLNIEQIPTVFSISQVVHDDLLANFGVNSIVVNNGIICSNFFQREEHTFYKPMRIIQVSRLDHDKKGQDILINAASILRGQIDVYFIGVGSSMEYLKNLSQKLDVSKYVHFLGNQTQEYVATHLSLYDLFVQPSRYEGFGLTVAEAMAAKLPVLVSEGQGPSEVTCGNKYGWTFSNGNAADLSKVICHIISNYDVAIHKAVQACRYVYDNYDMDITAKNYIENYGTITKK